VDTPRLEDLVEEHREVVHTYASYRLEPWLRRREPVSDIVQSALREVLDNPGRFTYQGKEAFRAFLVRAVEHKIANKRRYWTTAKREGAIEVGSEVEQLGAAREAPTPSEAVAEREELARLAAALDDLSEEDRRLLTMRRFAGLSTEAIAAEVGLSASTVRHHLGRIMTHLAYRLGAPPAGGEA